MGQRPVVAEDFTGHRCGEWGFYPFAQTDDHEFGGADVSLQYILGKWNQS